MLGHRQTLADKDGAQETRGLVIKVKEDLMAHKVASDLETKVRNKALALEIRISARDHLAILVVVEEFSNNRVVEEALTLHRSWRIKTQPHPTVNDLLQA